MRHINLHDVYRLALDDSYSLTTCKNINISHQIFMIKKVPQRTEENRHFNTLTRNNILQGFQFMTTFSTNDRIVVK